MNKGDIRRLADSAALISDDMGIIDITFAWTIKQLQNLHLTFWISVGAISKLAAILDSYWGYKNHLAILNLCWV